MTSFFGSAATVKGLDVKLRTNFRHAHVNLKGNVKSTSEDRKDFRSRLVRWWRAGLVWATFGDRIVWMPEPAFSASGGCLEEKMTQGRVCTAAGGAVCTGIGCRQRRETGRVRRRVVAWSRLCRACRDELAAGLESLPGLYNECGRRLGGSDRPRGTAVSSSSMPGMPFNAPAADVRARILGVLGSWSGMVAEERRVTAPERSVGALATFLGRHVDWIAAHTAATEATEEVAQLVRVARRVAYPNPVRRVAIGGCVEVGCGGELVAFVHPQAPLLPAEIRCDVDPCHSWFEHHWIQLSHRMGTVPSIATATTTRWLSAADISRLWSIPPGSVYRLASEQQWRRRNQARRTYYHEVDVLQTFGQRKPRSGSGEH